MAYCRSILASAAFAALLVPVAWTTEAPSVAAPAVHPRLISIEATRCATCHEPLLTGKRVMHAPATRDCSACHTVSIGESGTHIAVARPQPELCLTCHAELAKAAAGELAAPHPPAGSCLDCHDPHAGQVDHLLISPPGELCSGCHDAADLAKHHSGQLAGDANCMSCHSPHGSEAQHMLRSSRLHPPFAEGSCQACHLEPFAGRVRMRLRGDRLCTSCHADAADPAPAGGSRHPALQDQRSRAGCLSCHNPHMSDSPHLLVSTGSQLCAGCHGEVAKAAAEKTGHPPAADDCLSCHRPHRGEYLHLLDEPPKDLCATCHDVTGEDLQRAHLGADVGSLDCTGCHTPHGAGNPKLLERTVHPPVLDGCNTCHQGAFDKLHAEGQSALCLACHADVGELAAKAPTPHVAMETAACADCHNAHASSQNHLVKLPAGGACLSCHDQQGAGPDEVTHEVIRLIGCEACHEPHGGRQPRLLRKTGNELCLACHDPRRLPAGSPDGTVRLLDRFPVAGERVSAMASLRLSADGQRDHPVPGHRMQGAPTQDELTRLGSHFQGEITCLSCHDPHKGKHKALLAHGASSPLEVCQECHPK